MREAGSYDYIVVGAGSAGCVLANRLSADPDIRVLLLEAGGNDDWIWFHIPVGYLYCMGNPRADWGFRTVEEPGLNGRSLAYPRGRVLGGCSAINGMIYMRGQARDYDLWRQMGLSGWGWDDVLPWFRRSENNFRGEDEQHGVGGEWRVEAQRLRWDILDAFRDAAAEVGLPKLDDVTCSDEEGSGYFDVNQTRGVRLTTHRAFLKPVLSRPNLTVLTGALARRVVFEGRRAAGLVFLRDGEEAIARAEGEVVLSAGAIGSPHLLELSGIGQPERLQGLGLPVIHASPGVGENLQDHLQLRTIYRVAGCATLNSRARTIFGKAGIALEYALFRSGPMAMAPSQLGIFARSEPHVETPDLEFHVQPLSLEKFGEPLHPFPGITASVCHLRPESRGSTHLVSPDPATHPAIRPNYLATDADRRTAAAAIRLARKIMAAGAVARYRPEELKPGARFETEEELIQAAGDIGTTIFHPVGTARMGQDALAVVDERLRVRGLSGIRVVDAAVMPTIPSGNTNSPVIMIAEKASAMIHEDRRARAA